MKKAKRLLNVIVGLSLLSGLVVLPAGPAAAAETGRAEMQAARTLTAPAIDGRLDESFWSISEPLNVRTDPASGDDHRFGLLWDDTYLYIGVQMDDNTPISDASGYWFDQDNMNLFFDPTLHRSSPYAPDDMQIGIVYGEDGSTPDFRFGAALNNHAGKDEKKVLRSVHATETGWSAELAVPWEMLNLDPRLNRQFGLEVGATNRYDAADPAKQRTSYWSAYRSSSFWNDTSGYGVVTLNGEQPVSGRVNPVLFEENFDSLEEGAAPPGWIVDTNAGSPPFTVTRDTYSVTDATYREMATYRETATEAVYTNGRLRFNGAAAGLQSRITAPVQGDHYTVEADVRFDKVLNGARWAALMFRVPSNGKAPYNQMAVRQNGAYEFAYRKPDNNWNVAKNGTWQPLELGKDYTLKVRVFGDRVKEYIKPKDAAEFTELMDAKFSDTLLERGKVGFQADQTDVSFDNLKVTRLTADRLELKLPDTAEALTGPMTATGAVYYSDGLEEQLTGQEIKLYSSDENVIRIVNNQPVPLKEGEATVTGVYYQAEASVRVKVSPSATGAKVLKLTHDTGYILADAGEAIALADLEFGAEFSDYTSTRMSGAELEWKLDNEELSAADGKLMVKQPGVYQTVAHKDGAEVPLTIVAKAADAKEYVLYEENFNQLADGTLPEGWTRKQGASAGTAGVSGGAFVMNAGAAPDNPSRVILPDYLKLFGNYVIEADVANTAANNTSRWNSIMFRIQNDDYPYYQMAVRKEPSVYNGVEFAERTAGNQWNVMERGSYTEPMKEGESLHYTIKTYGNRVQEFIGDLMIIDSIQGTAYSKGGIGFQADGSTMRIDNVRVTLLEEPLPAPAIAPFVKVAEPDTRIALAPTVVTDIVYKDDLSKLAGDKLPATAIFHLNRELQVIERGGADVISSLDEALAAVDKKVIPAFYVTDALAVDRLVHELRSRGVEDVFIVSDQAELVKRARAAYPMIRGVIDFTSLSGATPDKLMEIRRQTAASQARVALLPAGAATRENVAYLQKRAIMVWGQEAPDAAGSTLPLHRLITAGANGMVTVSPAAAHEALKVYNRDTTLIRKVYMIGHRGMPSVSPENTIESNVLALDAGADYIENDMFLTKDGHLIITHSSVLETTTDGRGAVENFTLEELKTYNANKPYPEGFPLVRMPTLDEQLELARKRGRMLYAEIKTQTPAAVDAFVRTVKAHNAEDIVNVMSFYPAQLERLAAQMPELPAGLLTGYIASENNVEGSLRDTLKTLSKLNWTYNTDFSGLGPKFMEAAKHRGLLISPWTLNKRDDIIKYFKMGAFGITTDYTYYASDWAASLSAPETRIELAPGETRKLYAEAETYKGDKIKVEPEVVLISGQAAQAEGSAVKAAQAGTSYALLRYSAAIEGGGTYDLYTQPVAIVVGGGDTPGGENPGGGDTPGGENPGGGDTPGNGNPGGGDTPGNGNPGGGDTPGNGNPGGGDTPGNGNPGGGDTPGNGNPGGGTAPGTSTPGGTGTAGNTAGAVTAPGAAAPAGATLEAAGGAVTAGDLQRAFQSHDRVTVRFAGDTLTLPAAALLDAAGRAGTELTVASADSAAGYRLPLLQLAQALRGQAGELPNLVFTVRVLSGAEADAVRTAAGKTGGALAGPAVEFGLRIAGGSAGTGQELRIQGMSRYIKLDGLRGGTAAPAVYDSAAGTLAFTPGRSGNTGEIVLTHGGGGIYTAVTRNVPFTDMNGHWAEREAEKLAGRLLLNGTGSGAFEPGRAVTRAEFAAMLTRALGLPVPDAAGTVPTMSDVEATDWFAPYVAAAAQAELIGGYGDGTFRPDASVTRAEQAAMMARALRYAGLDQAAAGNGSGGGVDRFKDAAAVRWGKEDWNTVLRAGLFGGVTADTLQPEAKSTRAQSAVLLHRFLTTAGYID
ncbi:glycerophosphodiester phosphodiesterase family protein [Paenibacillus sp. CN-4]|uniref:glycerophosphodiester phosphodiesterase family protein n=1 Tax=Paenibacillus nanchangensis TaxID=3348343 RepID=UPI00397AF875